MKFHKLLLTVTLLVGICALRLQSVEAGLAQDRVAPVAETPITISETVFTEECGLGVYLLLTYSRSNQEGTDSRLAEWAKLPPPTIEKMKPFLGVWESKRTSDSPADTVTTFEVRNGVIRARHRVTPPGGAEPFQLEVQFIRVIDGQTLQWGLRNPSMGVILKTARLVDKHTLRGTTEAFGIPYASPSNSSFSLKRRVSKIIDELPVKASSQDLERERKRDVWQRPAEVFDALGVKPGHRVADIGSGSGYFTFRLAAQVGVQGKVYAVDIDQEAIDKVQRRKEREKLEQVESILGESDDPRLPNDLDSVLIVDSYHEFREFDRMMHAVFRALKPGGHLVIIDGEAPSGRPRTEYHRLHAIPAELVREEITRNGFIFKESRLGFSDPEYGKKMYFLIFERPIPNRDSDIQKITDGVYALIRKETLKR
jgi:predicted methyltransferase